MKPNQELEEILLDILQHEDEVMDIFNLLVREANFRAMRYKKKPEYERLLKIKKLRNMLEYLFKVTKKPI
jgi:hypothetical protein